MVVLTLYHQCSRSTTFFKSLHPGRASPSVTVSKNPLFLTTLQMFSIYPKWSPSPKYCQISYISDLSSEHIRNVFVITAPLEYDDRHFAEPVGCPNGVQCVEAMLKGRHASPCRTAVMRQGLV